MRAEVTGSFAQTVFDEEAAWAVARSLGRFAARNGPVLEALGVSMRGGEAVVVPWPGAQVVVTPGDPSVWSSKEPFTVAGEKLLDVAVPLLVGKRAPELVVAHLGQSADGRVSPPPGGPRFITGMEDIRHTHRMRALFDAVVVGRRTVTVDDPQLTTRHVEGDHPVRVAIDPGGRLVPSCRVLADGAARTLVVTTPAYASRYAGLARHVEVLVVEPEGARAECFSLARVRRELAAIGLRRLFVEGGGITVSRFLEEDLVDRLQIAVAPKIMGTAEPGIQLDHPRFGGVRCERHLLGDDVLFDFDLRAPRRGEGSA